MNHEAGLRTKRVLLVCVVPAQAARALNIFWKQRLKRMNVDDAVFWGQTLVADPPLPGLPCLRSPGDAQDKTVQLMREGYQTRQSKGAEHLGPKYHDTHAQRAPGKEAP